METITLLLWILFAFTLNNESSAASCNSTGSKLLIWTLYSGLGEKTWNEASEFCRQEGGHLLTPRTDIAMHSLQTWVTEIGVPGDIWIGLHSSKSNTVPNVWEADCSIRQPGDQDWDPHNSEPNFLSTDRCVRMYRSTTLLRTMQCGYRYLVICEKVSAGTCSYKLLSNVTVTTTPDASVGYVSNVSTCWSYCLELRQNGKECVAAVLDEETTICKLYLGVRQLTEFDITTHSSPGSTTMLRDCFQVAIDTGNMAGFTFTDSSNTPNPANVTCPEIHQPSVAPPDCLPPGVQQGLVTLTKPSTSATVSSEPPETTATTAGPTTTSATVSSEPPETTAGPTTTSATVSSEPPETTATIAGPTTTSATVSSEPPETTAGPTTTSATVSSEPPETTATTAGPTTTSATVSSEPPETTATTAGPTTTSATVSSEPPETTATIAGPTTTSATVSSEPPETTATNAGPTTTSATVSSEPPETTATTAGPTTTSATVSSEPPETTATTAGPTTTSATVSSEPPETTATTAGPTTTSATTTTGSEQCMCPCSCNSEHNYNGSMFNQSEPKPQGLSLIPRNETSKYRRSKTSAMMSETSYTIVGTTWIIAAGSAFGFFALCDLRHLQFLKRCFGGWKRRKEKIATA